MKKILAVVLVLTLSLTMFAACGSKAAEDAGTLNLYSWEGSFPDDVLADFTKETGIEVNFSAYDYGETMYAKLEASNGGDYDVVLTDDYILDMVIENGLAQKLDKNEIPNFGNINPKFQSQYYDENNEYTVPYGSGVQTIIYNPDKVDIEINGYEDLWDPSLENSIGIIGNYRVINGAALKIMGESYNTEDTAKIEEAGKLLKELAPNIRVIKDDNLQNDIINGEISAGIMYTSQVTMAMRANPNLKVVFPQEGIGFGIMGQFIPANAPNADAAHKFIDYILRPEVSARCFEGFGYYNTNKAADEFINPAEKDFLTLPESLGNMEMIELVSPEAEEAHSKVWTEFKAAQ